ncbi:MAG: Dabb family protein [Planctomycetes bacterium]|nr:Dabb family protein [Planctomycetota bacterium]
MFHHCVHFWLREDLSDADRRKFIDGVKAIGKSANVKSVRVGVPAGTPRPVVDNSYSVQLLVVFADKAAHDAYQSPDDPVHQKFIDTFKTFWTRVLIYDSLEA